jgi:hypothetical protein
MKVYELLKEKYENTTFIDGVSKFQVLKSACGELHLYMKGENSPCKFTAREIIKLDLKPLPVHFTKAIASEKDIYIKHDIFNKYEDDYLPLNVILKRISSFEPSIIKDIFANGEWFIKID